MGYIEWLRGKIGRKKTIITYADCVVRNQHGQILLQQRTDFDNWGLPGGVLELDEQFEACARREVLEETGLRLGGLKIAGVYTDPKWDTAYPNGDQVQIFTVSYTGMATGGRLMADSAESRALRWFDPTGLPRDALLPHYLPIIDAVVAGVGQPTFADPNDFPDSVELYKTLRPYVGRERLILPGAIVVVQNRYGQILGVRNKEHNHWSFPSGYTNLGENVATTAVREVQEECGISIDLERIMGVMSDPLFNSTFANGDLVKNAGVVFLAHAVEADPDLRADSAEIVGARWLAEDEWHLLQADDRYRLLADAVFAHLTSGQFSL